MDLVASSFGKWELRYSLAMAFYFLFWMLEYQSLHMSSLKKSWYLVKERWTSKCIKPVISKPSNTVILYYLGLNAFYVGVFSEINLISVKIIILNDFLLSWTYFELDIETYYFDSFLKLGTERGPQKSPKIKLIFEFQRLEISSGSISSMHTKNWATLLT